ncbi:DUF5667 domain-containing protein [Evansella sp. AB-P1]|uniref:DUF5667 domain-containing protein n=1 Tax=Evansella sp. AB-P1 TaxID=3037653 RepID=UPI00241DA92E|nr:DUF5667 domain-containing protein [Evansella sp. AB-P1]MDG5788875.1 DUF5667 domain-containing protein [Evansella sp. AB-P1]
MNRKLHKLFIPAVLIVSLLLGGNVAVADEMEIEENSEAPITEDVVIESEESLVEEGTEVVDELGEGEELEEEVESTEPRLVPGNFFYFVKKAFEQIQIALSFDDVKKGAVLAQHAENRLAEANALILAGDVEKAEELLERAIETNLLALEAIGEEIVEEEEVVESGEVVEGADEADEADENEGIEEGQEQEGSNDELIEEEGLEEGSEIEKTKARISNNIPALLAVLEKIENPRAQAAIMKNIEKSFGKLAVKLERKAQRVVVEDQEEELENSESSDTVIIESEDDAVARDTDQDEQVEAVSLMGDLEKGAKVESTEDASTPSVAPKKNQGQGQQKAEEKVKKNGKNEKAKEAVSQEKENRNEERKNEQKREDKKPVIEKEKKEKDPKGNQGNKPDHATEKKENRGNNGNGKGNNGNGRNN